MKLYADDSKSLAIVDTVIERRGLQKDLDCISVWMREWKMKLNIAKSKVVHFGRTNLETNYRIQDENFKYKILETTESERDLGIIVSSNFDWKVQINSALNKANRVLGMLKRTFASRETDLWKKLYFSMIRPHLEYAVQRLIGDFFTIKDLKKNSEWLPKTQQS